MKKLTFGSISHREQLLLHKCTKNTYIHIEKRVWGKIAHVHDFVYTGATSIAPGYIPLDKYKYL